MPREPSSQSSRSDKTKQDSKVIYWVFTINNPESPEETEKAFAGEYQYLVFQLEVGENGTPHHQGYVAFKKAKRLNPQLKKLIPRAHWEKRRGNHTQAKDYAKKEETRVEGPWEFGDDSGLAKAKGQRNDLWDVKALIDKAEPETQQKIFNEYFPTWCKNHRALDLYAAITAKPRTQLPEIKILWGVTGGGKSHAAREWCPDAYYLGKPAKGQTMWWDGYTTGRNLIIEEFYGWIDMQFMLRLLDKYALNVQVKGSMVVFNSPRICFTSNADPMTWYGYKRDPETGRRVRDPEVDLTAWHRRLAQHCEIIEYTTPYEQTAEQSVEGHGVLNFAVPEAQREVEDSSQSGALVRSLPPINSEGYAIAWPRPPWESEARFDDSPPKQ